MTPIDVSPLSISMLAERRMKKGTASGCYTHGICLNGGWARFQMPSLIHGRCWWPNLQHSHEPSWTSHFFLILPSQRFQHRMSAWVLGLCPCWFFMFSLSKISQHLELPWGLAARVDGSADICYCEAKHVQLGFQALVTAVVWNGIAVGLGWMCHFLY
jgi:hypothetical protein